MIVSSRSSIHIRNPVDQVFVSDPICCECQSTQVFEDYHAGILVCHDCGVQNGGMMISETAEWRDFNTDDGDDSHAPIRSRIGDAEDEKRNGLSTITSDSSLNNKINRLEGTNNNNKERILQNKRYNMLKRCNELIARLSLSQEVSKCTKEIYDKLITNSSSTLFRKDDILYLACIYLACNHLKQHRSYQEIAKSTYENNHHHSNKVKIGVTKIGRVVSKIKLSGIVKELFKQSSIGQEDQDNGSIERYCNQLKLSHTFVNQCQFLYNKIEEQNLLDGRTTNTKLAAILYLITNSDSNNNNKRSFRQIAIVTSVAFETIRKAFKIIESSSILR
jgi:transcription initiation factor TFIIB